MQKSLKLKMIGPWGKGNSSCCVLKNATLFKANSFLISSSLEFIFLSVLPGLATYAKISAPNHFDIIFSIQIVIIDMCF